MKRKVSIGYQEYDEVIMNQLFYVDKTRFIREWWENGDKVTLIARPRRFGKTLTMSMIKQFFSTEYKDRNDLFEKMEIWSCENGKFREMQGKYPVIALSFSDIKETSYEQARKKIGEGIVDLYNHFDYLLQGDVLNAREKEYFTSVSSDMDDSEISISLRRLSNYLYKYYHQKVIILLDEYDTPMQEAYVNGYWDSLTAYTRNLFNATFKSNPYLERAIMTGITRVSKESIFSDLNNLKVITTISDEYADCFGFTESEVQEALEEYGYVDRLDEVRQWYDGFTFGQVNDIYNPWSIINFLSSGKVGPYWTNTSSNRLAGSMIQKGSNKVKETFENLLNGKMIRTEIDEQVVYEELDLNESAVWSLLLASGYLKVVHRVEENPLDWRSIYELAITNQEVLIMFKSLVREWFAPVSSSYNEFVSALLLGDVKAMNLYMNRVAMNTFSFFDAGKHPSEETEPERFYHGFVLGLLVELQDRYTVLSNRESGFGRYDVMIIPKKQEENAFLMEFKVQDISVEKDLRATVEDALNQIKEKCYVQELIARGIKEDQIIQYGFAFKGKQVLIGRG